MIKKEYKKECGNMSYGTLLLEELSLKETIRELDDLKEKAQQDHDISSLCNVMNKRAECYEKLRIVEEEIGRRE